MGEGDFAVVPSSQIDEGNAHIFLPSCAASAVSPKLSVHPLSDTLTLVADASQWNESCPCHEIEPVLADCLKAGNDSVHASQSGNRLYVCILKNNALAFVNRFTADCDEDTLYHILAAYKTTDLDRLHVPLFVSGKINKAFLKKYFARCV